MNYKVLKTELQSDPAALGYAALISASNWEGCADLLNNTMRTVARKIIPSYEVVNSIVAADWTALTTAERTRIDFIVGAGDVDASNSNVRAAFLAAFGAGTTTRANLVALQNTLVPRATELGLPFVEPGYVIEALQRPGL